MENLSSPPAAKSKSKCFSFWPSRKQSRRKAASKVRISWPKIPDDESGEPKMDAESDVVCFTLSSLNTFARCDCGQKPFPQRMLMRPYFGPYAGFLLTFDIKRNRSSDAMVAIKVMIQATRVEPRKALTTLYIPRHVHRRGAASNTESVFQQHLKDRCVTFAHAVKTSTEVVEIANSCKQPPKLFFLCQQQVLLHVGEMNSVQLLPATDKFAFLKSPQVQNIFIRVYPSGQQPEMMLRMKVKPALSLLELKWMICKRLTFAVHPSCLELYQFDNLNVLSSDSVLQPDQSLLHCIFQQPYVIAKTLSSTVEDQVFVVSVIGKDIGSVSAAPSTSLYQFQDLVKIKFGLKPDSFVYFPNLGKNVQSEGCGIKMSTIVDKSTICLIDSMRRNLPIVHGVPLAMSKYEKLPLYCRSISSLGISSPGPVIAFEVTGPTIPLSFRAVHDRVSSHFTVVSDRVHALSVNPKWTIDTLLKYVECISKLPCVSVCLGTDILPISCNVSSYLTCRCWLVRSSGNQLSLANNIACITHF